LDVSMLYMEWNGDDGAHGAGFEGIWRWAKNGRIRLPAANPPERAAIWLIIDQPDGCFEIRST
jgi:hypothetical protein